MNADARGIAKPYGIGVMLERIEAVRMAERLTAQKFGTEIGCGTS